MNNPCSAGNASPPENLPPDVLLGMKLEGIFVPHARKQRDELFTKSKRFVHYASAANALQIIRTKRLWMRNTTCMVDYREVGIGYDMLLGFFSNQANREMFLASFDSIAAGAAAEALKLFDGWWAHIRFNTYVTSVAEHDDREDLHGRLSMWRALGGTFAKVALVFRVPYFSGVAQRLSLIFSPVAYMNAEHVHAEIRLVMENATAQADFLRTLDRQIIVTWIFVMLLVGVTCVKHEGFEEEREWRAIYTPKRAFSPLMISSTEVVGGVPQIVYQIPLDKSVSPDLADLDFGRIFDRLIVGPSPYPWAMYEAFADALATAGVADAGNRIRVSEIPLRST